MIKTIASRYLKGESLSKMAIEYQINYSYLLKILKETAKDLNIPWQYKLPTFGGTNAGAFHKMQGGIPSAGVSVPCRYIHSPLGQNLVSDVEKTIRVLLATISQPIELKF